jgi:type IV pilus assembly protein PilN
MIKINLLPFRAARKSENIRRQISLFFLTLILMFMAIVFVQISLQRQVDQLNDEITQGKAELERYKKQAQEVDKIKKQLEILKKKKEVLVKLDKNRGAPTKLLDSMTQVIVPNRMWFKNFTFAKGKLKIKGVALDEKTTADFMLRLEAKGYNVALSILKTVTISGQKMKSFQVTCSKAKKKTPPKKKKK